MSHSYPVVIERMKALRLSLEMNQAQFGEMLGSTGGCVSHYETGRIAWPRRELKAAHELTLKFLMERYIRDCEAASRIETILDPVINLAHELEGISA